MTYPIILTGIRANAEAAVFGTLTPIANEVTAPIRTTQPEAPATAETPVATPAAPAAFEVGKVYATRSLCDWDCIYRFLIVKRTAKSVWIAACDHEGKPYHGEEAGTRRAITHTYDTKAEMAYPLGTYSMCPTITALKGNIA